MEIVLLEPGERRLQRRFMIGHVGAPVEQCSAMSIGDAHAITGEADPAHVERQDERLFLAHFIERRLQAG